MDATVVLLEFVDLFVFVFNILLLFRVGISIVAPTASNGFVRFIFEVTEPLLAPIRKIMPGSETIDFSPFAAYIVMYLVQVVLHSTLGK